MPETDLFLYDTGARSDVGRVRDHNEDSLLARPDFGLWVVADGMGGHAAGDFASQTIVAELAEIGVPGSLEDLQARSMLRLGQATRAIQARAAALGGVTVGATLVALLIHEDQFACLWAGDSRIYLLRGGRLYRLTEDHTEVQQLLSAGAITAEQARVWPRRNVITRAIGIGQAVEPDTVSGVIKDGDRLLLCSDGLTEHLTDAEIAGFAGRRLSAESVAQALINETLQRGARDNVSVIVVDCLARPGEVDEAG